MKLTAKKALAMMYDRWEEGIACYEDPEDCTGFIGHAFKLSVEEENAIIAIISGISQESRVFEK